MLKYSDIPSFKVKGSDLCFLNLWFGMLDKKIKIMKNT